MQLQLLFLKAGCLYAVQSVGPLNVDESCSMQAYHALESSKLTKWRDSYVNADLLDKLVQKSKTRAESTEPMWKSRREPSGPTYFHTITTGSALSKPVNMTNSTKHDGILKRVHSFLDSRPEVKALLKAVLISWAIAGILGACAIALGKAKFYPPYKYLSWRQIHEAETTTIGRALNFWTSLETSTKSSILIIVTFFLVVFGIMWKMGVIQPVINQLACYVYVFLFFGILIGAVVADLLGKVAKGIQEQLEPFHKFREGLEKNLFLQEENKDSTKAADPN